MKSSSNNRFAAVVSQAFDLVTGRRNGGARRRTCRCRPAVERLESRIVPAGSATPVGLTPYRIEDAYSIQKIQFNGTPGTGQGQTIAIVDTFNDPNIGGDLAAFDTAFKIPAPPSFKVYNQIGKDITSLYTSNTSTKIVNGVPGVDPTGSWEGEEALDVEWAHALAPNASIYVVEANSESLTDRVVTAVPTAASLPGVSVVSMSFGYKEFQGESSYDQYFVTPPGHTPVTFVTSSGDEGAPPGYPGVSPNVVTVGGTTLTVGGGPIQFFHLGETGWSFNNPAAIVEFGFQHNSLTGSWGTNPGGASGNYGFAFPGNDTSTWSASIPSTAIDERGDTEVSATWLPSDLSATNATYLVYDGTAGTGTLLATVQVNQELAPVGTVSHGFTYQELGNFHFTTGTFTVVLQANNADGIVIADAIGLAKGGASGGGPSLYEPQPNYQQLVGFGLTKRTTPDVSFDADPTTAVAVYNSYNNPSLPWSSVGGTSLGAPAWSALFAIYDQGRAQNKLPLLDSELALLLLYTAPPSDFWDITSGYNGYAAGAGYDEVTGLGSPKADLLTNQMLSSANKNFLGLEIAFETLLLRLFEEFPHFHG